MTTPAPERTRVWPWFAMGLAGVVTFGVGMAVPQDAIQGQLSRILYVHVPGAWLAYLAFGVTMVASAMYLWRSTLVWDRLAASSAEVGVYFTGLTLVLGMIWGKPTWGVWWTWDARLTLTAIMFFVYLGYLALRRTTDDIDARAKRSAILGVLAVVQIPLVHFSVVWWRSLHQAPTLLKPESPDMDGEMVVALLVSLAMFTLLYVSMLVKRMELARLEEQVLRAEQSDAGPVAGAAVTAPNLGEDTR